MTTSSGVSGADGSYSSPPYVMQELDSNFSGSVVDPVQTRDVARLRKAVHTRLIAARLTLEIGEREANASLIAQDLDRIVTHCADPIVSVYWPFRGEPDLRTWMTTLHSRGTGVALPAVLAKGQPLQFRIWQPSAPIARAVWEIPFLADGAVVVPTLVIAPLVVFDPTGFRLGYGGGFFDRTLAALDSKQIAAGVGHPTVAKPTIYPQPHDIPMDRIVTGIAHSTRDLANRSIRHDTRRHGSIVRW